MSTIANINLAVDVMIPLTVFHVGWCILRARQHGPQSAAVYAVLALALLWGAAWSWVPSLSAIRFSAIPQGQAGAIFGLILALNVLRFVPSVKAMFRSIDVAALVDVSIWRAVYGAALLAIGLLGGLPSEFFWSAAIGDILVGLWGMSIMQRRPAVKKQEVLFWNAAGLLDLVHVLALGAIYLRGFYLSNPEIAPLNLLPLVGVPILLSLHLQTLLGQLSGRKYMTKINS